MRTSLHCAVAALLHLAAIATAADWPHYLGPDANLSSVTPGVTLSTDPATYRKVWSSQETGLGRGKCWSQYPQPKLTVDYPLPGGLASPLLAGGLVYLHYFQPKAGATATAYHNYQAPATGEDHPHYRILADDIDVAIDAATGRTVWKHVSEEPGVNLYTTKRGGWGVTGCVHAGQVFAMDTLGQVLAYDAKTGQRRWVGGDASSGRAARDQAVQAKNFPKLQLAGHLAIIGGLLIAPQYGGKFIALDPDTGTERWSWKGDIAQFCAAGFRAVAAGRELILVPGRAGVTCLNPADGTALWHLAGPGQDFLSVHQDRFLFVDCEGKDFLSSPDGTTNARWALYQATPEGPKRLWRSRVMTGVGSDGGPQRRVPIDGTLAFLPGTMEDTPPITQYTDVTAVDVKTGAVAFHRKWGRDRDGKMGMHLSVRWENLLVSRSEADDAGVRCIRDADPARMEGAKLWTSLEHFHYGYQTVTMDAYGDGIAYVRSLNQGGCIEAWDLRLRAQP